MSINKQKIVIIGGGITGLSAGIVWAKNRDTKQYPITIFEKQPIVGGCVTSFRRKGYLFDTAQIIPDIVNLLDYLGVQIPMKKFEGNYCKIFKVNSSENSKKEYVIQTGPNNFKEHLVSLFPKEEGNIRKFMDYSEQMYNELFYLKLEPNFLQKLKTVYQCPKILRNMNKTFSEYLKGFISNNDEITEILNIFAAFSGMPADRTSALMIIGVIFSTLNGSYRPINGFIQLPQKMKKRFEELGGKIRTNCEVNKIIIENGKVKAVQLKNGELVETDNVITTIDTKVAMKSLVGIEEIIKYDKEYAKKVEEVKMSCSSMTISLGLDDDIDLTKYNLSNGYNVITTGGNTFSRLFDSFERNETIINDNCFHIAVICPTLTLGGKNILVIRVLPLAINNWAELRKNDYLKYTKKKEEFASFCISQVEKYIIPDLKQHIVYEDIATPATFERLLGSPTGSNYDMSPYTNNFGKNRLKMRTAIKGLYHPEFSHGIWPSMQSGFQVIDMITSGEIMQGNARFR